METFKKIASCIGCDLKLNLFCLMTDDQLVRVNKNRHEVHFKAGETIIKTGSPLTHMICVINGLVKVYLEEPETGKRTFLKIAKPVELVLGPGFLVDNRHHFTAVAIDDCSACYIEIGLQKEIMMENPEYSMAILKHVNSIIIRQFQKMLSLAHKHIHGKLAETLLYLSTQIYKNNDFETKLSRQDLADLSGMTKETTIRALKDFSDEKLISCQRNQFKILDMDRLQAINKYG